MRYNDDLAFDFFPQADTAFVVSYDHYTTTDEFLASYYVFNTAGQCIDTIAEYTSDYLWMSDIRGQEEQYCFMLTEGDDTYFSFVDVPFCKEVLRLSSVFEGNQLSANLDRYPSKDGYRYVFSLSYGVDDAEDNTIHSIAWLNQDGSLNHYDKLNLGQGIQLANHTSQCRGIESVAFQHRRPTRIYGIGKASEIDQWIGLGGAFVYRKHEG